MIELDQAVGWGEAMMVLDAEKHSFDRGTATLNHLAAREE
jgi:hypothetical protein